MEETNEVGQATQEAFAKEAEKLVNEAQEIVTEFTEPPMEVEVTAKVEGETVTEPAEATEQTEPSAPNP